MNFEQAVKELKGLAKGEYCKLKYEEAHNKDGQVNICCYVYIHGYNYSSGESWETALHKMNCQLNNIDQETSHEGRPKHTVVKTETKEKEELL